MKVNFEANAGTGALPRFSFDIAKYWPLVAFASAIGLAAVVAQLIPDVEGVASNSTGDTETPNEYTCDLCGETFDSAITLALHRSFEHSRELK